MSPTPKSPLSPDLTASLTKLAELVRLFDTAEDSLLAYCSTVQQELAAYTLSVATGEHPELQLTSPQFQVEVLRHQCYLELLNYLIPQLTPERN